MPRQTSWSDLRLSQGTLTTYHNKKVGSWLAETTQREEEQRKRPATRETNSEASDVPLREGAVGADARF